MIVTDGYSYKSGNVWIHQWYEKEQLELKLGKKISDEEWENFIDYYMEDFPDPDVYDKYESRIIIAKSRYGNIGRHTVGYDGNICKFFNTIDEARNGRKGW